MRILIDMDGVIANFEQGFLDLWRTKYPDKLWIPLEERTTFYPDEQYPEDLKKEVEGIAKSEGFYLNLQPIEGGLEAVKDLERSNKVFICTSPHTDYQYCVKEKFQWVDKYLGRDWVKRIILTKDKTLVKGDVLIDDRPSIKGVAVPEWKQVLYDQPYNRSVAKPRLTWKNYKQVLEVCVYE